MHLFKIDYPDHSFQELYDTLKRFYPIDLPTHYTIDTIQSFAGFDERARVVEENFVNPQNYRDRWTAFQQFLRKAFTEPVHSTLNLFNVCYSGEVVLEHLKTDSFVKRKTLHFFISTLGPYFSIVGLDSTEVLLAVSASQGEPQVTEFPAHHALTVSPSFEYEATFRVLEQKIREWFPTHSFVPYEVGMSTLKGISIEKERGSITDTVYEGIFGHGTLPQCRTRGDKRYGFSDWTKPLTPEETDLMNLLLEHILQSDDGMMLHKVWKLKDHKLLESFDKSAGLFYGMDLFDVIDLTDPHRAIVMVKDGRAPDATPYELAANVIVFPSNMSLRIIELENDILRAVLSVDIHVGEKSINGDLLEMRFDAMKRAGELIVQ